MLIAVHTIDRNNRAELPQSALRVGAATRAILVSFAVLLIAPKRRRPWATRRAGGDQR
jgi:hypothetical protein